MRQLLQAANAKLSTYRVGQYLLLAVDAEHAGNRPGNTGSFKYFLPSSSYDKSISSFRDIFWSKGYYCDRSVGMYRPDIICLCKVLSIKMAEGLSRPQFIVENVATHQKFDFATIEQDKDGHPIMPYLLTVYTTSTPPPFLKGILPYTTTVQIQDSATYVGANLSKCTNDEAAAHLKHIAMVIERERKEKEQAQRKTTVDTKTLDDLYRQLGN